MTPEVQKPNLDKAEKTINRIIGQLIVSKTKRILVFGVDSMKKLAELALNYKFMLNKARDERK